jgi:DNA repair protein RadA/Sms
MVETLQTPRQSAPGQGVPPSSSRPVPLASVDITPTQRLLTGIGEFDHVVGGGIVPGSVILVGGDPGVGKSTLLLQVALEVARRSSRGVLYITGEESLPQLKLRASRISSDTEGLSVLAESDVDAAITAIAADSPCLAVVDSIQTMRSADLGSAAGSIGQVRESASRLIECSKKTGSAIILVGHVTKEGGLAGPKTLEHMVDVVLHLDGDSVHAYRLLRGSKNRFGPTHEVGVFDMREAGMVEVANPSALFMNERGHAAGSLNHVVLEGTRPMVVEIQALTSRTAFGLPRRTATGIDLNRLHMLTAVLARRGAVQVADQDIYVNVVGGLDVDEPAADLPIALAIVSSHRDVVASGVAAIGEVGLGGEIRAARQLARRIKEGARLGLTDFIVPSSAKMRSEESIRIHSVPTIAVAIETYLVLCTRNTTTGV